MFDESDICRFERRLRLARELKGKDKIFALNSLLFDLKVDLGDIEVMIEECEMLLKEEN